MTVVKLRLKAEKREKFFDSFFLAENHGIEGDPKAKGGERQVSLGDEKELLAYRAKGEGLCVKRYMPNVSTSGLDYSELKVGDKLKIGVCEIEITKLWKECFPECELVQCAQICNMKKNCAFAKVIRSGEIHTSDEVIRA